MDRLKEKTIEKFTKWDLNCKWVFNPKSARKYRKIILRSGRRIMNQETKKEQKNYDN